MSVVKHVVYGQKSVLLGDEAADALMDYAAHVAQLGTGGRVDMHGISAEGNLVTTTFLLNSGVNLAAESTTVQMQEPDNREAVAYIPQRIDEFSINPNFFQGFQFLNEA